MAKIFISYRRDDSQYQADRLHALISPWLANPREDIFIDVDNIPFGVDFEQHLAGKIGQCDILLAVIGAGWLDARNQESGLRRLDDPEDFVRIEIAAALKRGIPVVPVLLDGAPVPKADQLPDDLKPLAKRNGIPISRLTFEADVERLMEGLGIERPAHGIFVPPKPKHASAKREAAFGSPMAAFIALAVAALGAAGAGVYYFDPLGWFGEKPTEFAETDASPASTPVSSQSDDASDPDSIVATGSRSSPDGETGMTEQKAATWTSGDVFSDCTECPSMIVVPAGKFTMGSPSTESGRSESEGPQRTVAIGSDFAVGRYEVTWTQYLACMSDGACPAAEDDGFGEGNRPVTNVDWDSARKYTNWLSAKTGETYRLLSEAEWEYAARAGTTTPYSFGRDPNLGCSHMNGPDARARQANPTWTNSVSCDDGFPNTAPIGSFSANWFGLHDMHGNVWEWTQDCWNASYEGAPKNGSAWTSGDCTKHVIRGSSWRNFPEDLRSASRDWCIATRQDNNIGFRVARTL